VFGKWCRLMASMTLKMKQYKLESGLQCYKGTSASLYILKGGWIQPGVMQTGHAFKIYFYLYWEGDIMAM
jgi:hypothetical protein